MLVDTVCRLAGAESLIETKSGRLKQAILNRDTPSLFEHLVESFSQQGISDHAGSHLHGQSWPSELARSTASDCKTAPLRQAARLLELSRMRLPEGWADMCNARNSFGVLSASARSP
jgi:hypothetical protein